MGWTTRRATKRKTQATNAQLKKLCRYLVVELRDKDTCQRCGNTKAAGNQIHWAHVRAGRAETLQYQEWASMALCAGCHFFFDGRGNGKPGTESRAWWAQKWPDRDLKLTAWEHQRNRPKFDPVLTKLALEHQIQDMERQGLARTGESR